MMRSHRLSLLVVFTLLCSAGVTVEGLLFYPVDYRAGQKYPLIVSTHGGPAAPHGRPTRGSICSGTTRR